MATFAECLAALPTFRNDLLRRQNFEQPFGLVQPAAAMSAGSGLESATTLVTPFTAHGAYAAFATPLTNVHATGVGIRQKGGEYDPSEHVLKVFVFDKVEGEVPDIPRETETGIPVDVEYMPIQVVRATKSSKKAKAAQKGKAGGSKKKRKPAESAEAASEAQLFAAGGVLPPELGADVAVAFADQNPQRQRHRPIVGGLSISPMNANFVGTLGCFLRRVNVDTEEVFALSNNHVLSNVDRLPVGTPVVQPGPEVPPFVTSANDAFAALHTSVPILFPNAANDQPVFNRFDAAIANVTDGTLIRRGQMFGIPNYDPSRVPAPTPGMRVMKMGRTTGLTRGRITATNVQGVQVNYGTPQFPRIAVFQGVLRIIGDDSRPFSLPGDSGSVILEEATGHPVALLFAGDGVRTTACDLGALCQQLGAWPI